MNPIFDYFRQAELSLAAYANLIGGNYINSLKQAGMSDAQATKLVIIVIIGDSNNRGHNNRGQTTVFC